MFQYRSYILTALGLAIFIIGTPVSAQDDEASTEDEYQSGYGDIPEFGGPDGGAGVAAETAFSTGVEITRRFDEIWTIGAGWARPSETTHGPGLRDEWVIETSYKFQLSRNFSLTPDVQVLFNPANNPGKSSIWVAGVRAILTL
jgi:hypothetical protein